MSDIIKESEQLNQSINQALKEIDESNAQDYSHIKIKEFLIFYNQRIHAAFNDESSMIIHPNRKCITYFSSKGHKTRLLNTELPNFDSIKHKYRLMCLQWNEQCDLESHIDDEIVHSESKIEYLSKKQEVERWVQPGGATEFTNILPTGEVFFTSLGQTCFVGLSLSGEEIYIEYMRYLPSLDTKVKTTHFFGKLTDFSQFGRRKSIYTTQKKCSALRILQKES